VRYPNAFSQYLLEKPVPIRVGIAVVIQTIALLIYTLWPVHDVHGNFIVFIIPVVLSAWILGGWGFFVSLCVSVGLAWLYYGLTKQSFLPSINAFFDFLFSFVSVIFIGWLVSTLRNSLVIADEIAEQLEIINEEQQQLSEIKDQFLQNVNHELRTPLTAIYGYLELLLEYNARLDNEMRVTFLQHAMQSCDELQLLVNNVLDSMGIEKERKALFTEELVVRDNLFEVLERFDPKSVQMHDICVDIPDYIVVIANAQYLRQVFRNLLSNAFKYAPSHTPIMISARLYGDMVDPLHAAPEICISVEDRGPGIPANEISQLFGQFVRLRRDTSGHIRGSGLGLFLSKQFVEAMNGRIWVESEGIPGRGSNFRFTLPCVVHPKVSPQTTLEQFAQFRHTSLSVDA
jgi:signal transduction histidine kinase